MSACIFIYQGHLQTAAGCGDRFTNAIQSTWYAATGHEKVGGKCGGSCASQVGLVGISVLGGV